MSIYDIEVRTIRGEKQDLSAYRGQVMLIVNTASKCGFTPQYTGLQQLYDRYRDRGFVVLGFPSSQFANQEYKDEAAISEYCQLNHGVTFPLHAKIAVRGRGIHPLFNHLTHAKPGILGTRSVKWNFTKFLVDRKGQVIQRYAPKNTPEKIEKDIVALL